MIVCRERDLKKKKKFSTEGVNNSDNVYLNNHVSDVLTKHCDGSGVACMSYIVLLTHKDKSESVLLAQTTVQHVLSRGIYLVSETALKWLL